VIEANIMDVGDGEAYTLSIVENSQRADLSPIEEAQAIQKLMDDEELSQLAVAKKLGKSRTWVAQKLRLLNLPEDTQESIKTSGLTEAHGRQLLKLSNADKADEVQVLAERAAFENWTVRRLETEVNLALSEDVSQDTPSIEELIEEAKLMHAYTGIILLLRKVGYGYQDIQ
jgi:ParB family chromosome partitioning protein